MRFFHLNLVSLIFCACPTPKWQKAGESSSLKYATNIIGHDGNEVGEMQVKMIVKQDSLPKSTIDAMGTKKHVQFTIGVLLQQCVPDVKIHSEFTQISVKTGNCESAKGAFTLVTLQSAKNVKTTGLKGPLVKKALTGFTARITGLPVLDGETNFKASCKNFKNKNCLFPFYVAVLDGHDDLACIADADGFDNTPQ